MGADVPMILKAPLFGVIFATFLSAALGWFGKNPDFLSIHHVLLFGVAVKWSWPLFFGGTFLGFFVAVLSEQRVRL